ncbi:jasmonic acid-amido synthetase JAR1-like [Quillaja saponaria]|uniref:Jasmonic acid-amido synthetase JAR1-like n=1 Tax=Quillaja saponaria TaxID=32244 RepID=A0AAD7VEN9_QUISA|nr:jasmonic acid-amido synthetase JAR1-like [Quillaja saponaria]
MTDEELITKLEESTKNATHHQLQTLRSILQHNGGVRYLQPYLGGYNAPIDAATFRNAVPLSCYDDYVDYINQMADCIADHDEPLLSVDPLVCFFHSSGAGSMKSKLIPYFDSDLSKAASSIAHLGSKASVRRLFPPRPSVNKMLCFLYAKIITITKGGLKVMAASSYNLQSGNATSQLSFNSSPLEVLLGSNFEHQMYCHLLCGLVHSDVIDGIVTPYAIGLIKAFGLLESRWEQICYDLDRGFLTSEISEVAMRDSVNEILGGPQQESSKRIRLICEGKDWSGIARRLWPNIRYIRCITTGSMKQYYPKLKNYAGEVPILGGDYFASECCVGINLDIMQPPETTEFVMLPTAAFFEFLPFDINQTRTYVGEETVDSSGVEVGKMYEVVVTTYRGLYRYRLGDVVRVVGFHNSSPKMEFVMRAPKTHREIVTERGLISTVENFQLVLRGAIQIEILEFASFLDLELRPQQLKLFVEVAEGCMFMQEDKLKELAIIINRCSSLLESGLGAMYKVQRDEGSIGSLLIFIVKPGTFDRLSQVAIENGTPASQYKPPKIIQNHEMVDLLERSALVKVSLDS